MEEKFSPGIFPRPDVGIQDTCRKPERASCEQGGLIAIIAICLGVAVLLALWALKYLNSYG
jgi:hypothetical protein